MGTLCCFVATDCQAKQDSLMPVPLTLLDYASRTSVIMHKPRQFKTKLKTYRFCALQNWEAEHSTTAPGR